MGGGSCPLMPFSGEVASYDAKLGWGHIRPDDLSDSIFVHQRSIMQRGFRSLLEGELRADSDAQTPLLYMSVRPAARPRVHTTLSPLR